MKKYTPTFLLLAAISPLTILISCSEAFGPKSKIICITLSDDRVLLCNETYNADIHSVSYDVNFKLITKKVDTLHLGDGSYNHTNWEKDLHLSKMGKFYLLPVKDFGYLKLLIKSINNQERADTTLSPIELRDDSLWRAHNDEIPGWAYPGSSQLDSIKQNRLFISFEYRIEHELPFSFYNQTIEYEIDTLSGKLSTKKVFERKLK